VASVTAADAQSAQLSLGMLLRRAEQDMLRVKNAALKPVGLTLAQYVALTELDRQPAVIAATLARACLVTPQAMMVVLNTLEQQGLVARSPHPRHANVLELRITAAGREALHAGRERVAPVEARIVDAFSPSELRTLRKLLGRWSDACAESRAEA
jgi:DNA-binding MarR family transcriptional regulator